MPEIAFETLDAIPEPLRPEAEERDDGKVYINVVPKKKLDEFRDTNIKLSQERDSLTKAMEQYKGLVGEDPDGFKKQYSELQKIRQRVQDGELVASTSLEEAISSRTKELRADLEGKLKAIESDRNAWKDKASTVEQRHRRSIIDRAITNAVVAKESGARTEALSDILERAYKVFKVEDKEGQEQVIPYAGDQVMYGADGASPMSPAEWLGKLRESSPYFFQSSGGGGGGSGEFGSGAGGAKRITAEMIENMSMEEYTRLRSEGKIR